MKFKVNVPIYIYIYIIHDYSVNNFIKTPLEHFLYFFPNEIFDLIVEQSNLYSLQKYNKILGTNLKEIKDLIGIHLIMGIVKMPAYSDYWAPNRKYEQISNVMSIKRYQQLMKCLHFSNNEDTDEIDRHYKVQNLLNIIRENCLFLKANDFQ